MLNYLLLVEDNPLNQQVAIELLQQENYIVELAENGQIAIDKIKQGQKYDLILMDLQMPIMNGFDAVKIIQLLPEYNQCPILAMTANVLEITKTACLTAGMRDIVEKPFDINLLFAKIKKWINLQKETNNNLLPPHLKEKAITNTEQMIDPEIGLMMVVNNKALYLTILDDFIKNYETSSAILQKAWLQEDNKQVFETIHSMITASGVIGATQLSEFSKRLQTKILSKNQINKTEQTIYLQLIKQVMQSIPQVKMELNDDY